jgi:hypothetical protein
MRLGIQIIVSLKCEARETKDTNDCGPFPKMLEAPETKDVRK